jgi:manganese/zinc/iron transport system substrate-binding protein
MRRRRAQWYTQRRLARGLGARGRAARRARAALLLALTAALLLAAAGCAGGGAQADTREIAERKMRVTTTTNWHTDLARRIGGDRVKVTGLMGPGVDPHLYEATAGDVRRLGESDIVIWNGLQLEGKMEEVFAEIGEHIPVVAAAEAVPLSERIRIEGVAGKEFDPHIWFDTRLWRHAARAVADGYKRRDPRHAAGYNDRLRAYEAELRRVDADVRRRLERVSPRSRVLVTSHDAFSYFARAYRFEVASIQGKSTAGEATTADIERAARIVADRDLEAVFVESSVPRQTIEAVLAAARKRGQPANVGGQLFGDALGAPGTPAGAYAGAVRHNADAVAEGLGS